MTLFLPGSRRSINIHATGGKYTGCGCFEDFFCFPRRCNALKTKGGQATVARLKKSKKPAGPRWKIKLHRQKCRPMQREMGIGAQKIERGNPPLALRITSFLSFCQNFHYFLDFPKIGDMVKTFNKSLPAVGG
jgi:hypothetical protein